MKSGPVHGLLRLWLAVMLALVVSVSRADPAEFQRSYAELLVTYWHPAVTINGIETTVFDYAQMKQDAPAQDSLFNRTLKAIERVNPEKLQDAGTAKAFWINAYNFAAIRLVIDHYPVDSIRSLSVSLFRYPWSKKAIRIGERSYSLKQIEKDILLTRFDDPRIVLAISCAALSCPDRISEPFVAERLDAQLDAMIRSFFRPNERLAPKPW